MAASAGTQLVNEMVEQFVSGSGAAGATALAAQASAAVRADAAEQAQVRLFAGSLKSDVRAALVKTVAILTATSQVLRVKKPPATPKPAGGMSTGMKVALVGGGLAAVYFLFIRK